MNPRFNPIPCFLGVLFLVLGCGTEPKKSSALTNSATTTQPAQGPKGDVGPAGKDGAPGAKGDAGPAGKDGAATLPGLGTIWTDPDSGTQWQFLANGKTYAEATCPEGWKLPGDWKLPENFLPGKFFEFMTFYRDTLPRDAAYWTSETGTVGHVAKYVSGLIKNPTDIRDSVDSADTETHLVVCTK